MLRLFTQVLARLSNSVNGTLKRALWCILSDDFISGMLEFS